MRSWRRPKWHCGAIDDIEQRRREDDPMTISQELLDILACPQCKGDLVLTEGKDGLVCGACKLRYAIQDDIPIMLIDEATRID